MIPRAPSVLGPGCVGGKRGERGSVRTVCLEESGLGRILEDRGFEGYGSAQDLGEGGKCCGQGDGEVSVGKGE